MELPDQNQTDAVLRSRADATPAPDQYAVFSSSDFLPGDFEKLPPGQVLLEDGEISGYLKLADNHGVGRRVRPAVGFLVFALALAGFYLLPDWELFSRYVAPLPAATPQAQPYARDVPLQFRDVVDSVNADLRAGGRKEAALAKLLAFIDEMKEPPLPAPTELQQWAVTEALVLLASRDIPPTYAPDLPDRLYGELVRLGEIDPDETISFRALSSFIILTASGRDPAAGSPTTPDLIAQLNTARDRYPAEMDARPDLLIIEAESHIAAMPDEYVQPDAVLDFHWRRAAYAINLLYQARGRPDAAARRLDRARWTKVENYFRFKFSFSYERLGRIASVRLDGTEYTRDMVRQILRSL